MPIVAIIALVLLGIAFPRAAKHLLFAPILGTAFGGFAWALACICFGLAVSWSTFGGCIFVGTLLAEFLVSLD